ncbi:MAG TPA: uroporphyrinogen-III synthase [Ginsengibacter sp.]|nr:uroporphyrinogen-III synthase [Ginsengibacter sp.]HRP18531.1 uroporphyrinogen-III synthase [Ginsengibacter sp.]HRP45282.1 uroporphyrinogen-III synthase [Ginsengibacter sp.]
MNTKMASKPLGTDLLTLGKIKNVLITQARPESEKSPYFDLEKKYGVSLEFQPLTEVLPISSRDFRKQKIDITAFSAVIFTSRNAIDHFFRTCEEMRITVSQDMKYFCVTESIALYLQKFTLYRKRKVFYGENGTNESLFEAIKKHKEHEKFLYPCSENFDSEITNWLASNDCDYAIPVLYKVELTDITELLKKKDFQVVCIFTPLSVKSWLKNQPDFSQDDAVIGVFGDNTRKALIVEGFDPEIVVPNEHTKNMATALDIFLGGLMKK